MGADVDEACMTWRKGLRSVGASNSCMSNVLLTVTILV
jgi:hypothetical protein